jgi:4-amino-4-deoxy-L-arabinose transferase-like glycosyltransferase
MYHPIRTLTMLNSEAHKRNIRQRVLKALPTVNHRIRWIAGVILLLLTAYALRVWNLGRAELSFDEVATFVVARRPPLDIIRYVMRVSREHPPLYYIGMHSWFRLAGTGEFALRYPSTLISLLTVAWGVHLGRKLIGCAEGGWWSGALFALMPLSLWAARNGRMYALVMLLAMMTLEAWWRWTQHPTWLHWAVFMLLSVVGAMTHYFLILLWPVEGVMLLLTPRHTRTIRWTLLGTIFTAVSAFAVFAWASTGVRAMALSTFDRFPLRQIRLEQLRYLITELYTAWPHPTLLPLALAGLGITAWGWMLAWRKHPAKGALLFAWGFVPVMIMNFVPVSLVARYLIMIYPALIFGLAATVALASKVTLASGIAQRTGGPEVRVPHYITIYARHILRLTIAALILVEAVIHWDRIYLTPDNAFSQQIDFLHAAACPGDALLMNGPWPSLLLNYYDPPAGLSRYLVPEEAPPGFNADVDIPRLAHIIENHDRIWTFYGAIRPTDPHYTVSRWLAEHAYAVHQYKQMVLYLPPSPTTTSLVSGVSFGPPLNLRQAEIDKTSLQNGKALRLKLTWDRAKAQRFFLTLVLVDAKGHVWQKAEFGMGPVHRAEGATLPAQWSDLRGMWIRPGIPPGEYTLGIRVDGEDVHMPEGTLGGGWFPLGPITVGDQAHVDLATECTYLPIIVQEDAPSDVTPSPPTTLSPHKSCPPHPVQTLPNWANIQAVFGPCDNEQTLSATTNSPIPTATTDVVITNDLAPACKGLKLVGLEPRDLKAMQGYPLGFRLWWEVLTSPGNAKLNVRLVKKYPIRSGILASAPHRAAMQARPFALGPTFYPATVWRPGNIIQQDVTLIIPEDLPGGAYHVQVQVLNPDGSPQPVNGSRDALTVWERWQGRITLEGEWADLFIIQVEAKARDYRPPLRRQRADAQFGEILRLRGYRLSQATLHPGISAELTIYWQALQRPDRIYAAFNHLRGDNTTMIWQQDSWPQAGIYTTDHWLKGEVVEEHYTITIPPETPPGEYPLYVGIYDAATGDRLTATNARGKRYPNDQVPLLTIEVLAP